MLKNRQLKAERGYTDPKSYVRDDGSEVLYGRDWTQRKRELWERANGRCERNIISPPGFERCRSEAHDPHHILARSRRRDDRLYNLIALCRMHHDLLDWKKIGNAKEPVRKRREA